MKKLSKSGHHFGREHGFTGSCAAPGAKYVASYYRGGRVKEHEDEAEDRKLIRREIKKELKKR